MTYGNGRFGEGDRRLTAVLRCPTRRPKKARPWQPRRGYGQAGDSEKAIADYTAVLQMPDAPAEQKAQALVDRGWMHFVAGRNREAIEDERQAVSLDPKNCTARGKLAIALLVDGQTGEAMAACDEALAIANAENLADMASDIQKAVEKHGPLDGADEALRRIEARRKSLEH